MDNGEGEQEHGRPDGTLAVVVESELEVTCEEDGPQHHQQHVPQQEDHSTDESGDSTIPVRRWLLIITGCWCCRHSGRCSADLAHHLQVLRIFLHGTWLVDHVPLLRGILAQVRHDRLLSTRVNRDPFRHINRLSVHHDPSVVLLVVLRHLLERHSWWPGRRGRTSSRARLELLAVSQELVFCHVFRLLLFLDFFQRVCDGNQIDDLLLGPQCRTHAGTRKSPRVDGVEQGHARSRPRVGTRAGCHFACSKQPFDRGSRAGEDLALVHCQATRAGVGGRGDHSN
mmetsp:Transcript_74985/g.178988  ORF Transcript_74985/g.178988 Transcript_74985/m.178988 type:complete len:284 (-) Transcript_74985:1136-1987(-)